MNAADINLKSVRASVIFFTGLSSVAAIATALLPFVIIN